MRKKFYNKLVDYTCHKMKRVNVTRNEHKIRNKKIHVMSNVVYKEIT